MSSSETPYVETEILLSQLNGDVEQRDALINSSTGYELVTFQDALEAITAAVETRIRELYIEELREVSGP